VQIKPSAAIRNNYNEIASLCKQTGEPVYLTKNGEGDLVVMDVMAYENLRKSLEIEVELLKSRYERLSGGKTYTIAETLSMMDKVIKYTENKDGR
jgi:prevent-host-death family protein